MAVCPGIANSSESVYIRTFVDYAQNHGYRVIVLNHLGALKHVPLTAPRIFTYGKEAKVMSGLFILLNIPLKLVIDLQNI